MSNAQILAYAAPVVLTAVGGLMLWITKARLARRQLRAGTAAKLSKTTTR